MITHQATIENSEVEPLRTQKELDLETVYYMFSDGLENALEAQVLLDHPEILDAETPEEVDDTLELLQAYPHLKSIYERYDQVLLQHEITDPIERHKSSIEKIDPRRANNLGKIIQCAGEFSAIPITNYDDIHQEILDAIQDTKTEGINHSAVELAMSVLGTEGYAEFEKEYVWAKATVASKKTSRELLERHELERIYRLGQSVNKVMQRLKKELEQEQK